MAQDYRPDVLFLDNHLLVVNKPAGMLSQEDATGDLDVVTWGRAFLKERFDKPGRVFLGLVHRLDRPASGVMVLARTSKAAARLSEQFRQRTVEKVYLAVVEGECAGAGILTHVLAKRRRHVEVVDAGAADGKRAELQWRGLAHADGLSLVEVRLKTGRAHQVRVQLAHIGHPILGDVRYGARRELDGKNLALHAFSLRVSHPIRRAFAEWYAEPPPTWPASFEQTIHRMLPGGAE